LLGQHATAEYVALDELDRPGLGDRSPRVADDESVIGISVMIVIESVPLEFPETLHLNVRKHVTCVSVNVALEVSET
jgi:hypothetical protein